MRRVGTSSAPPCSRAQAHAGALALAAAAGAVLHVIVACGGGAPTGFSGPTGAEDLSLAKQFPAGARTRCNWRGQGSQYPGAVTEVRGGWLFIRYDDGDTEQISPRLCTTSASAAPSSPPAAGEGGVPAPASGGCSKDMDCKGDRICIDGKCVAP